MAKKDVSKIPEGKVVEDKTPITQVQYQEIVDSQNAIRNALNALASQLDAIDAISFASLYLHSKRTVKLTPNRVKKMQKDIAAVHESMAAFRKEQMDIIRAKKEAEGKEEKKDVATEEKSNTPADS